MKIRSKRVYTGHLDPPKFMGAQKASVWKRAVNVEPLVCMDEWHAAQVFRDERRTERSSRPSNIRLQDFLLAGILRCADCGANMQPKSRRKASKRLGRLAGYYKCRKAAAHVNGQPLDADTMHRFVLQACKDELVANPQISSEFEKLINNMEVRVPTLEAELKALADRINTADIQHKRISELYDDCKILAGYDRAEAKRRIRDSANERVNSRRAYRQKEVELQFAKEGLLAGHGWLKLIQASTTKAISAHSYWSQALLVFTLLSEVKVNLETRTVHIQVKCPDPKLAEVGDLMSFERHFGPEVELTCQGSKRHVGGRKLLFGYANLDGSGTPSIVDDQAAVVRRIFELRTYTPPPSFSEVAKVIQAEFGEVWTANAVRNLARNPAYCGAAAPAPGRKGAPDISYPAIVSKEQWLVAQG